MGARFEADATARGIAPSTAAEPARRRNMGLTRLSKVITRIPIA
jgi:hypothetical protein